MIYKTQIVKEGSISSVLNDFSEQGYTLHSILKIENTKYDYLLILQKIKNE